MGLSMYAPRGNRNQIEDNPSSPDEIVQNTGYGFSTTIVQLTDSGVFEYEKRQALAKRG